MCGRLAVAAEVVWISSTNACVGCTSARMLSCRIRRQVPSECHNAARSKQARDTVAHTSPSPRPPAANRHPGPHPAGEALGVASRGTLRPPVHYVDERFVGQPRVSFPFFLRPRPDAVITPPGLVYDCHDLPAAAAAAAGAGHDGYVPPTPSAPSASGRQVMVEEWASGGLYARSCAGICVCVWGVCVWGVPSCVHVSATVCVCGFGRRGWGWERHTASSTNATTTTTYRPPSTR